MRRTARWSFDRPWKFTAMLGATLLVTVLFNVAPAAAAESLVLDTYSSARVGQSQTVATASPLTNNVLYAVRVQGTWSAWNTSVWAGTSGSKTVACGTTEPAPQFPSPGTSATGRVGEDAEYIFGAVEHAGCRHHYPYTYKGFQTNIGTGFTHLVPLGGVPSKPTADHVYMYVVTGLGSPISFHQLDSNTRDDYGAYHITVEPGAASCPNNGWQDYNGYFSSESACNSYFNPPGPISPSSGQQPVPSTPTTPPAPAKPKIYPCNGENQVLAGTMLGPVKLGMTQRTVRTFFARQSTHGRLHMDYFCTGFFSMRVGYGYQTLAKHFKFKGAKKLNGKAVLVLTDDSHYTLRGIKPFMTLAAARTKLHQTSLGKGFVIGRNTWYLISFSSGAEGVLKVRHGVIQEIGIATKGFTAAGRKLSRRFLSSFLP